MKTFLKYLLIVLISFSSGAGTIYLYQQKEFEKYESLLATKLEDIHNITELHNEKNKIKNAYQRAYTYLNKKEQERRKIIFKREPN